MIQKSQKFISCANEITDFYISGEGNLDFYIFSVKSSSNAIYNFKFSPNDLSNFQIKNRFGKVIKTKEFKLKPNAAYILTNMSVHDATSSELMLKTNAKGLIVYSSKANCD